MPDCQPIALLELDDQSIKGLKRIQKLQSHAKWGTSILSMGKVMMILYKASPNVASWNISTTDWEQFTDGMKTFPNAFLEEIKKQAGYQILNHPGDRNQRLFWQGIRDGCSIN